MSVTPVRQRGFTLVEIAIVLVIIGLLLGGVLKGQGLIDSARVKNIIQQSTSLTAAVNAYQDKFRAL
ncbi:MAG: prepilin-type N-terminal cleavage/methylation domain-containing protein, partial [Pseudomonadota bacterium]